MLPHVLTQTPGLPSAADLSQVHPVIAGMLIVAGLLLAFSGPIRERLGRKPPDPPAAKPTAAAGAEAPTGQLPSVVPTPALERAEKRADEAIERLESDVGYLRQQLAGRDLWWEQHVTQLRDAYERRIEQLERKVGQLEAENQRLWRGPR